MTLGIRKSIDFKSFYGMDIYCESLYVQHVKLLMENILLITVNLNLI